jgi:hypothetical protein
VQDAIARTGIDIEWHPFSKDEAYSHSTRIRALRRDVTAAYAKLKPEQKGQFAQIVVKSLLQRFNADELRQILLTQLADIDWTISEGGHLATLDALISEHFFPFNAEYDAYIAIRELLASAASKIVIVDTYVGSSLLITLKALASPNLTVNVLTVAKNLKPDFRLELANFRKQVAGISIEVRTGGNFHDRYIVIDDARFYHVGASIKDAGIRAFMISRIEDRPNIESARYSIAQAWAAGIALQP